MRTKLINILIAVCVVATLFVVGFQNVPSSAAEAPEQPIFELLKSTGVDRLVVGETYSLGGDLTVTLESAINGKGTQVDLELVKRTGTLLTDPSQKFTGIFAEKGTRTNMAPAAISETEDVHYVLAFNKQVDIPRAGDIDNDPKPNNNEAGAFYIVNGQRFVVPISKPNVDNEVAFVQVNQVTDKIEYESDDSWHSIIMIRVPQTTTTPTPTIPITLTATPPTVTATPIIPPGTQVYTVYLSIVRADLIPTSTPTPSNDCRVLDAPGREIKIDRDGNRYIKPARGSQVLLRAESITGDNSLLTIWKGNGQLSANNEYSFRANPGRAIYVAKFNGQAPLPACTIRVEVESGDTSTATPAPPTSTPQQPTPTRPIPTGVPTATPSF